MCKDTALNTEDQVKTLFSPAVPIKGKKVKADFDAYTSLSMLVWLLWIKAFLPFCMTRLYSRLSSSILDTTNHRDMLRQHIG